MSMNGPEEKDEQNEVTWTPVAPGKEIKSNYVAVVIVSVLLASYASLELHSLIIDRSFLGGLLNQIDSGLFGLLGIFSAVGMLFRWPFAHKTAIIMVLARIIIIVPLTSFIILPPSTVGLSAEETQLVINASMTEAFFVMAIFGILLFSLTRPRVVAVFRKG